MDVRPGDWGAGRNDPVPKHKRNPRRAYDAEGREIEPATVANVRTTGATGLLVDCTCGHRGRIGFDGINPEAYVPDIALRLVCSSCGKRGGCIEVAPDWVGGPLRK